jgi:hypothetical protein
MNDRTFTAAGPARGMGCFLNCGADSLSPGLIHPLPGESESKAPAKA